MFVEAEIQPDREGAVLSSILKLKLNSQVKNQYQYQENSCQPLSGGTVSKVFTSGINPWCQPKPCGGKVKGPFRPLKKGLANTDKTLFFRAFALYSMMINFFEAEKFAFPVDDRSPASSR